VEEILFTFGLVCYFCPGSQKINILTVQYKQISEEQGVLGLAQLSLKIHTFSACIRAWAYAGEGKGALALPPWPAKAGQKYYVFRFFLGKIVSFSLLFRQKVSSSPPPGNFFRKFFVLPWKKVCGRPCIKGKLQLSLTTIL
jgi:hypothetical protein